MRGKRGKLGKLVHLRHNHENKFWGIMHFRVGIGRIMAGVSVRVRRQASHGLVTDNITTEAFGLGEVYEGREVMTTLYKIPPPFSPWPESLPLVHLRKQPKNAC